MQLLYRVKRWVVVGRHVSALRRRGYVVTEREAHNRASASIAEFSAWALSSGALNDGVPRHTRKEVVRSAQAMLDGFPNEVSS